MEAILKDFAGYFSLGLEACAAILIALGGAEAFYLTLDCVFRRRATLTEKKAIWLRFGMWLLLGLEFELAADILRTAISPSWTDIGQLAAIAAIRTFLNFFLERDLETAAEREAAAGGPDRRDRPEREDLP
jgi:uncharacterized membrane protein